MHSLQQIKPEGKKHFLTGGKVAGGHYSLKGSDKRSPVYVCEGFATAATIFETLERKSSVLISFNAGNLQAVAEVVQSNQPSRQIIIAADNDRWTQLPDGRENPGIIRAKEAAAKVNGLVVLPIFSEEDSGTDFNDLANSQRLEAVKARLKQAHGKFVLLR